MGKRIVVKVGSNVLTREDGKLDVTRMSAIVDQIVWLRKHDYEVILVSMLIFLLQSFSIISRVRNFSASFFHISFYGFAFLWLIPLFFPFMPI